jgi:hypothetical protein
VENSVQNCQRCPACSSRFCLNMPLAAGSNDA